MSFFKRILNKGKTSKDVPNGSIDLEEMLLKGYYYNESVFRNQVLSFPRYSDKHPATLEKVLSAIYDDGACKSIASLTVASSQGDVPSYTVIDTNEIASLELFPQLVGKREANGNIQTNIVLLAHMVDSYRRFRDIVLHLKGTYGIQGKCHCMRVSVMGIPRVEKDSQHSFKPGSEDSIKQMSGYDCFSFLLMEDYQDMSDVLKEYEKCESVQREKSQKDEQLSELEQQILEGRWESKEPDNAFGYGKWLSDQERWFDSYRQLIREFRVLQRIVNSSPDNTGALRAYFALARRLGGILHKMGRLDEAYYFLSLSCEENSDARDELHAVAAELMDLRITEREREVLIEKRKSIAALTEAAYQPKDVSVGFLMNELFGAPKGSLTFLSILRNKDGADRKEDERDHEKIWNYPIHSLTEDGLTAVIGYSPVSYVTNNEADKSILCVSNVVVLKVTKATTGREDDDCYRFYVVVPPFAMDPGKYYPNNSMNIPDSLSFIVGKKGIEEGLTIPSEDLWAFSRFLMSQGRFLEADHAGRYALQRSLSRWDELNAEESELFFRFPRQIGYALVDFRQPERASYYLGIAAESNEMESIKEYINSLSNSYDIRTLKTIDHYIEMTLDDSIDNGVVEEWRLFLKRRKAYNLIESNRFVEAKILLQELMNSSDPLTRQFAESEYRYVLDNQRS